MVDPDARLSEDEVKTTGVGGEFKMIVMDEGALCIIETLNAAGFEAYAVGGCVRDALLNKSPEDWDITTSAMPDDVKALFPRTFDTGIEHGTVSVLLQGRTYEVTTYRTDGDYKDHRHPEAVSFTKSLFEDVARRDFTINAMAYHPVEGLKDFFGGQKDLSANIIRCVGDPKKRFDEDALRMLRAVRFASRLSFAIEEKTLEAICEMAPMLRHVSRERVMDEVTKTLMGPHPEGLEAARTTGLVPYIAKSLGDGEELDFESPGRVREEKAVRFAALLHRSGSGKANAVLRELKSDNETRKGTVHLLQHLDDALPGDERAMRFFLHEVGKDRTGDLLELKKVCVGEDTAAAWELYEKEKNAAVTLAELSVSGKDLIAAGFPQSQALGEVLAFLLKKVIEDPSLNTKDKLLELCYNQNDKLPVL
ncbi:MAG: CCA tRNA nucleotidyltransferase [Clostridia bacterium]|nr:CCA tRNA nucleotidyltransferase [Clostridia bacterium]